MCLKKFRSCITKTNSALIDNAEDLSIVMLMYNLLEHSQNYFMTSVSLQDYYRDEVWRSLDLPLINCEIELQLKWTRNCVLIEKDNNITRLTITSTKLYVPVVTLSINDNIKFLENINQGFKRTISCNKYRSEITTQPKKK